jgi:hypothetical protein
LGEQQLEPLRIGRQVALWAALAQALGGCGHPVPAAGQAPPVPLEEVPRSRLAVTVRIPWELLRDRIEQALPLRWSAPPYTHHVDGGEDNCGAGYSVGFVAERGPVQFEFVDGVLQARTALRYWVSGRARSPDCLTVVTADCGSPEAMLSATTGLDTRPWVGSDWHFNTRTTLVKAKGTAAWSSQTRSM